MRWPLALLAVLALPSTSWGEGAVQVTPSEVDEGRPVTLHVAWVHSGSDPAGLLAFEAQVVGHPADVAHPGPIEREALWLDPLSEEAVTLDVEASEDLGAQARAPMPPVTGQLAGAPVVILRQVVPGESLSLSAEVAPEADALRVEVRVRRLPLRADGPLAGARVLVPGGSWAWSPGAQPRAEGLDLGAPAGPPAGAPDPLGLGGGGGAGVGLHVRLTRWVPRGLGPSPEVLLRREAVDAIEPEEERHVVSVSVRPAAFGRAAAVTRSGLDRPTDAVRLPDDRWVVEDLHARRSAVVGASGAVTVVDGRLFPAAIDLARAGRLSFTWYDAHERPELAKALEQGGFVKGRGKGLMLEVTTDTLVAFLELLKAHGARLEQGHIAGE